MKNMTFGASGTSPDGSAAPHCGNCGHFSADADATYGYCTKRPIYITERGRKRPYARVVLGKETCEAHTPRGGESDAG